MDWELDVTERGKTWITTRPILVVTRVGLVLVHPDFVHDSYSFAPNWVEHDLDLPPHLPAIVHDCLCRYQINALRGPVTRKQADDVLLDLMSASTNPFARHFAKLYWLGVRAGGWYYWRQGPKPITKPYGWMYGDKGKAFAHRVSLPVITVGPNKRLTLLPAQIVKTKV